MTIEAKLHALTEALARVEKRAQAAEDYIAISNLQRTYGYYVDKFQWEQVADLFARDAIIEINARGKFKGHERIREYMRHFGPAQRGVLMNHIQLQPVIHIDEDGETAQGRWRAMMQVGELGGVARLYVPYEGGWGKEALPLVTHFDDLEPDEYSEPYPVFPDVFVPPYHYTNPVSGRE